MSAPISFSYTTKATCLTCNRQVAGSIKSTGNFYSHIDKRHPELSKSCREYCIIKPRMPGDMKVLKIRRPLIKPIVVPETAEMKVEPSTSRPKILDGKYFELVKKWSNGRITATCRFCSRHVSAYTSSADYLLAHIRLNHHEYIDECRLYCNKGASDSETPPKRSKTSHTEVKNMFNNNNF